MKYLIFMSLIFILLFPSCDYLDMVPEDDIETVETIFEQRKGAETWWVGIYGYLSGAFTDVRADVAYVGADEFVTCEYERNTSYWEGFRISDGLQMSQTPYGERWSAFYAAIRNCNTFLENIDNVYNMEDWEKREWKADVQALKAFIYFELMRRYGPIALVPENLPADADVKTLQLPRLHVDTCFKEIINLLDESLEYIPLSTTRQSIYAYTFCRESVLALKAKVLLYAASPLFNGNKFYSDFRDKEGNPLFSDKEDKNKWRLAAEAADEAVAVCESVGRHLSQGTSSKNSDLLNTMADIENSVISTFSNSEFLLEWKWSTRLDDFTLPRLVKDANNYNSNVHGDLSPSMTMVEMYYTEHGLPIDQDNSWNYVGRYKMSTETSSLYTDVVPMNEDVLQLHLRREPRFYASIAGDRLYWQRGTNTPNMNYNLLVEARQGEKWGTDENTVVSNSFQNINGYWLKKHTNSAWTTYGYANNYNGQTAPLMRLAEVYLMQAEAWNEYLEKPDSRVYDPLNKVRERAGIPKVVSAWKSSYSANPSRVDTKEGMREIIRQEINIELAFEGHRYWNLRRWLIAHEVLNKKQYGWNIVGASAETFYNRWDGPIVVSSKSKFTAPRDYLDPIKSEEILISSMVQNPGW